MEKNKDLQTAFDNLVKATKEFQDLLSGEEVDISIDGENILEVYILTGIQKLMSHALILGTAKELSIS